VTSLLKTESEITGLQQDGGNTTKLKAVAEIGINNGALWLEQPSSGWGSSCGDARAHSDDGNPALNDSSPFT